MITNGVPLANLFLPNGSWTAKRSKCVVDSIGQKECETRSFYYNWPAEQCNGLDDDGDGTIPDDETDGDHDGWMLCEGDCNDQEDAVYPGAPEICDGKDNDCDGTIPSDEVDSDGDGVLDCEEIISDCSLSCSWHIQSIDSGGPSTGIDIDSHEYPHIAYYNAGALKYAYFDGVYWNMSTIDASGDSGRDLSLKLDNYDHAHISYFDNWSDLGYAYNNGTSWEIGLADSIGQTGSDTSIIIDSFDNPHVSYHYASESKVKHAYFDGSEWFSTNIEER